LRDRRLGLFMELYFPTLNLNKLVIVKNAPKPRWAKHTLWEFDPYEIEGSYEVRDAGGQRRLQTT
jgi:hypothetical protein